MYMYLKNRANKGKSYFLSVGTIDDSIKISKRTGERALSDLEKVGFVKRTARWRKRGGQSSNRYVLSDTSLFFLQDISLPCLCQRPLSS